MKINPLDKIETIEIVLTEEKFPIAYAAKLKELMEQGHSETEAKQILTATTFVMEIYYSPNNGLFAVESGALEVPETVCDPYTGQAMEDGDAEENLQRLVDMSIDKIKQDIRDSDLTVIEELLKFLPVERLEGFLCIDE